MYRLFKFRSQISYGPQVISIKNSLLPKVMNCSNISSCLCLRFRSTTSESIQNKTLTKTKQFKKKKQFTEVVQVTNGVTSQSKVKLKHLKPNQVHKMVSCKKPVAIFPKTEKKKKNSSVITSTNTESNMNKICLQEKFLDDIDEMNDDQINLLKDTELLQTIAMAENDTDMKFCSNSIKEEQEFVDMYTRMKSSKAKDQLLQKENIQTFAEQNKNNLKEMIKQMNIKGREKSLNQTLLAYIDLCVCCGFLNRGLAALTQYCYKSLSNKISLKITDINIFTCLMHGFASKGNYEKLKEIWKLLELSQVKPNIQVYAATLECLINKKEPCPINELQKVSKQLISGGFSFQDLFDKCIFIGNQREQVLKAVYLLDPSFVLSKNMENIYYSCPLLDHLNKQKFTFKCPAEGLLSEKKMHELVHNQIEMEMASIVKVKSVDNNVSPSQKVLNYRKKLELLQEKWKKTIRNAITRELEVICAQQNCLKSYRNVNIYPYLRVLNSEQYVDIILQEVRKLAEGSETFSPTVHFLYRQLANQVRLRYQIKYKKNTKVLEKIKTVYSDYCSWYINSEHSDSQNTRQQWQKLVHKYKSIGADIEIEDKQWSSTILNSIGKFLYNIIIKDIKIDVNIMKDNNKEEHLLPAFYTVFRGQGQHVKQEIKPHPILSKLFQASKPDDLMFDVSLIPMLSPPIPWTSINFGGYIVAKADLIRLPQQAILQWYRLEQTPKQELYPALDALNQLASIPWTINKPVLDVVLQVFRSGGSSKLDIPKPTSAFPSPQPILPTMTKEERSKLHKERALLKREKAETFSLWCDALYRLSLANHFCGKIFWLPHNMDFRGRVYPCPPHLNHLGSDMARSLLCFAKGKPLGANGLNWLKIHCVNLTGLKKRDSIKQRLQYANEILQDILDSAENPLQGKMWWAESESPWQTLACCIEISRALQSKNPEHFISNFPVHQDGSCNGLQHYAALGRDYAGAVSVNLTPSVVPQDVYSCVAAMVERERCKDAKNNIAIAKYLDGFVRRKVIKQTVMTTVYGVTRFGARLQIAKQLKDIDSFPKDKVWPASTYLVSKTFESLREMFTSTKEIQDWFTECARIISQSCGQSVEWITPLGLPVVQPYNRRNKFHDCSKQPNNIKIGEHFILDMYDRPNIMKQKNAFPPNFIHSLDSSHMMLTSLHCERAEITYVSVHDCFWTHPSTVEIMGKVCREQFLSLHNEPILENLSNFMINKYKIPDYNQTIATQGLLNVFEQLPKKGNFNLNSVLDSTYFFS
ncbi:DNA-directed RNA polymerase, N-terminal,Pentatricopeptide repeat,DNA-directed RNA [Cinara cedri]|uniref:DNA-directed RNA polymerase n=1 Tax=Cinara cedri TaxID=506608 RepID=A0A5E4N2X7_9HEMI|nr:DNA-directed RNA polymerase, N-terminal,Pentatricopeptide repeat,DNA-directed RNA [Cinara cedri]